GLRPRRQHEHADGPPRALGHERPRPREGLRIRRQRPADRHDRGGDVVRPLALIVLPGCSQLPAAPDAGPSTAAVAIEASAPASLFAGTTMDVACTLLDAKGQPVSGGAAATVVVGDTQVLQPVGGATFKGHRAGSTTVTCRSGSLTDATPATTLVLPGSPAVVTTRGASASVVAGSPVAVTCAAADGEGNDASGVELPTLSLGSVDAGSIGDGSVTFTKAGAQTVTCAFGTVKGDAAPVTVAAARPASLSLALAPVQSSYRPGSTVTAT